MFKVYRRGAARVRGGWAAVPMPAPRRPPFPQRQPAPASPRRLRQFGFRKKRTRTQACELPTQRSVGFLLAGGSGCFTVRERRSGPRPCFSLPGFVPVHFVDELGRVLLFVFASTCAQLWHEFGLQLLRGVAPVSPGSLVWMALQSCQGPAVVFGHKCAGQGSNTLCWDLWHSWAMLLAEAPSFTKNTAFIYF